MRVVETALATTIVIKVGIASFHEFCIKSLAKYLSSPPNDRGVFESDVLGLAAA